MRESEPQGEHVEPLYREPEVKELPGRSFLLEHPELAGIEPTVETLPDGRALKQTITSSDGRQQWEKRWHYVEKQAETGPGRIPNAELSSVTEVLLTLDERGNLVHELGRDVQKPHAWEKQFTYDQQTGKRVGETGQVTEGKMAGTHYETVIRWEQRTDGEYEISEKQVEEWYQNPDGSISKTSHIEDVVTGPHGPVSFRFRK